MKRSEAARWARWSAATACLLALLTVGVYLDHKWVAHREKEKAPPPAPAGVARQESKLTFSKGLGAQKLFTVEALGKGKLDRKSTRLNSSHRTISYAVFCLKKKKKKNKQKQHKKKNHKTRHSKIHKLRTVDNLPEDTTRRISNIHTIQHKIKVICYMRSLTH